MNPVMGVSGDTQIFCAALGDNFIEQIAPGIVGVAVTPVFRLVLEHHGCANSARVLCRGQAVQQIIGEGLVAASSCVFVIRDPKDVSVITRAKMEVITKCGEGLGTRLDRYGPAREGARL